MENFGRLLSGACDGWGVFYMHGRLGAGKTTLSRGILRGLGHTGVVKSPTFTLVEPYTLSEERMAYHFDLYRLGDPEELELMGGRDYFEANTLCIIEWPERGSGWLPVADIDIHIEYAADRRHVTISSNSAHGDSIITAL